MLRMRQVRSKFTWYRMKLLGIMLLISIAFHMVYNKDQHFMISDNDDCSRNLTHCEPCFQSPTHSINVDVDSDGMCPDTRCAIHTCNIALMGYQTVDADMHVSVTINGTRAFRLSDVSGMYIITLLVGCLYNEVRRFSDKDESKLIHHLRAVQNGTTLVGLSVGAYFLGPASHKALSETLGVTLDNNYGVLSFIGKAGFPVFSNVTWEVKKTSFNHTYQYYIGKEVNTSLENKSWDELIALHQLKQGGNYSPPNCIPRYRIAIIIPFRNRFEHLGVLINNLVPFLKTQMLAFTIFIIDQEEPVFFNRATLLNIGYIEANKLSTYDCFVFHDVDLIPLDLCNTYYCGDIPRHLCVVNNKHKYRTTYFGHFGGANIMNDFQMKTMNGYSNRFFGWGKEDDEMFARTTSLKLGFVQQPPIIGRYYMIRHKRYKGNPLIPKSLTLKQAYKNAEFCAMDGLSTLSYQLTKILFEPLFTHIGVQIPGPMTRQELDRYKNRIGHKPSEE